jgi:hypothetical protein
LKRQACYRSRVPNYKNDCREEKGIQPEALSADEQPEEKKVIMMKDLTAGMLPPEIPDT